MTAERTEQTMLTRISRVQENMNRDGADLLIITPSSYLKYLTGLDMMQEERFFALILPAASEPFFIANILYEEQLKPLHRIKCIYWKDGDDAFAVLKNELEKRGIARTHTCADPFMRAGFLMMLIDSLQFGRLASAAPYIDPLRVYKDEAERASMREACRRADRALENTMKHAETWPGRTEQEYLAALSYELAVQGIRHGGGCICAGRNAAEPHHAADSTLISQGAGLLVDFGGDFENYNTDMTRNFFFGKPDDEYLEIYKIVQEANQVGKEHVIHGSTLGSIDAAVRAVIEAYGYGKYFTHRTGHGIGIDCHEGPSVQFGEKTPVSPGMCFSIEPGIYIPGKFGVRIEDQILVTENGYEVLHSFSRELQII